MPFSCCTTPEMLWPPLCHLKLSSSLSSWGGSCPRASVSPLGLLDLVFYTPPLLKYNYLFTSLPSSPLFSEQMKLSHSGWKWALGLRLHSR